MKKFLPFFLLLLLFSTVGSFYCSNLQAQIKKASVKSTSSGLIINEIDSDTEGTDALEFVELYDGGVGNTSLDGYVVVFYNGSTDLSYAAYDLDGYTTNAAGYFVLGNSAVENVNIIFSNNFLQNGADAVALFQGNASDFPNGTAITTTNLVDAIVYDTDDADDSGLLALLNSGQAQINENGGSNKDYQSIQRIPNGSGGARNTSTYTTGTPSPGTSNGEETSSQELTIAEVYNVADGANVTVSGVLTVSDQFNGSAYLQDNTGGIAVYDASVYGAGLFAIGDSIKITGTKSLYYSQTQIGSLSSVTSLGAAVVPITPKYVGISKLSKYVGELVTIYNPVFPNPGNIMFGNSNYIITDTSGSGELRIDADAPYLAGDAQPETCSSVTGIVGRYNDIYELMPRMDSDIPCASKYTATGTDLTTSKDQTLDVAAWNMDWFGDESNSPTAGKTNSDEIQKDSIKSILNKMDADIIGVEEISDDALFAKMVSEMNGYSYVLSDAVSYPNTSGTKQKVGFIYKTSTVKLISTKVLLASIHPYYNGGDTTILTGYPATRNRFYASGRMPFMLTADVTINGVTQRISFIDIHARANSSSDAQLVYDMRKYDIQVLKDTLDAQYSSDNIVLVGDYNDDVDVTVADVSTTVSTYQCFVDDPSDYNIVTSVLSENGYRSYVTEENMIDHILVSNELKSFYMDGSARVGYEYYNGSYTSTTSDHMPVSARFILLDNTTYNSKTSGSLPQIAVSPNPFDNKITITCNCEVADNATFLIYSSTGSVVYEKNVSFQNGENIFNLNLNDFNSGIYILKTKCNSCFLNSVKIVKQ
jgi:exonuclease III